jgi:universal stress protein A
MPGWKKILCPIDFSETSREAMVEGLEIAKRHGAQLFLLHVLEERWPTSRGDLLTPPDLLAKMTEGAERDLMAWKAVAEQIAPGRVVTEMVGGHPATEILRVAREGDFDLIVMGTHGRRGLRRLVVGSVADEVSRTAPCSVTVVRPKLGGEFDVAPD